ncbi:uncharacterized protein LOC128889071 [Hylaeus anthracinus]|uniref:uncharacterized protein LOC128872597 n=1 Tax=Hylaeus volcanicus TaxID=313075 RepID=UPI0023B80505|nr:uncharacterized protein LOC128872597 [Hylaeus volcanicus]XP_054002369.1 uncharacterized protein LOC128889071 [Hylaeus anthracinus]
MKNIALFTFCITMCLLLEVQGDCKGYQGKDLSVGTHYINCLQITCNADGSISALGCPAYQCAEGSQIGYRKTDLSKPYPECCEGPICAD